MKKIMVYGMIATFMAACGSATETKVEVRSDSADSILLPPDTSANTRDTQSVNSDSSGVDSSHLRPDAPANNK